MYSEYSFWLLIPIIIISLIGSIILYYYPKKASYSKTQLRILSSLRFLSILLILFLVIFPIIKNKTLRTEKPIIVLAQDNSSSIIKTKDSTYYKTEYKKEISALAKKLSKDYDLRLIGFGSKTKPIDINNIERELLFDDYSSDINSSLVDIEDEFYNSNLSGIILLSDGIINKGLNPLTLALELNIPIYTVGLGDTTLRKDLFISNIRYNKISYLNNKFPIEIIIGGNKAKGSSSVLRIITNGKTIYQESFNIDKDNFSKSFTHILESKNTGIIKYRISLDILENESIVANNTRDVFIEILDSKRKILILGNSPHPDISALKQSIQSNEYYEVDTKIYKELPSDFNKYSLIVLHDIPSNNPQHIRDISRIREKNIPILYIIGSKTNLQYFNSLNSGIRITSARNTRNDAIPKYNQNFTQFSLSQETQDILSDLPPLSSPFGSYDIGNNISVFAYQNISNILTNYPLIAYSSNSQNKEGFIIGEGLWRWRLINYSIKENHNSFNELVSKSIQYITTNKNIKPLRLIHQDIFSENQPINIDAELYNESFELVNTPDIELSIKDSKNKKFEYVFGKTSNAYNINIGLMPQGNYEVIAKTNFSGKVLIEKSNFIVSSLNLEEINLKADHNLLFNISNLSSGKFYNNKNKEDIIQDLRSKKDIKPVIHSDITKTRLIDSWWFMAIILLLLSLEWFLRKFWTGN